MGRNLGAVEAAAAIRGKYFTDRSFRGDPEEAHRMKFARDVAKELGTEAPEDVIHIMGLLREEGIELHAGNEYPKYATRNWDRTAKIVHDAEEEKRWVEEPKPEDPDPATAPPLRTMDAPVQDLSNDLRNSVPGPQNQQDRMRVPKVPPAVTNREAAQDAYARQPVESRDREEAAAAYDAANPGIMDPDRLDAADAAMHHGDNDDEVHIEDLTPTGNEQQGGAPYAKPAGVGVMAHDDPDGDGIAGQDDNPTHDSVLGTQEPQPRSGESSAGKTDTARRPVGNRRPT